MRRIMLWFGMFFTACPLLWGQGVDPATIPAQKLSTLPTVDGVVSAAEWAEAFAITTFYNPVRGGRADLPTRAYLGYTDDSIYVAFVCEDSEPALIQAQQTRRGSNLETDDRVVFAVDPQARGQNPYQFIVNPRGAQRLVVPEGVPENVRWQGDWDAAARLTETGWSAEMRIPFRILRVGTGQNQLGVAFARFIPRRVESYIFPNTGAYFSLRLQTLWQGIEIPRPAASMVVLPYLLSETATNTSGSRGGIDVKWSWAQGQTALLTFNPDFSAIAADVASVDFSYTERALNENRPFFVEGNGFFPWRRMFYSVRVPQLNAGAKAFGRFGAVEYGVLAGEYERRDRKAQFAVGRTRYRFNPQSYLGLIFTENTLPVSERIVGFEGAIGQLTSGGEWQLHATHARLSAAQGGSYTVLYLYRSAPPGQLGFNMDYTDISPGYAPTLAFVPERGWRGFEAELNYNDQPAGTALLRWSAELEYETRRRYSGGLLNERMSIGGEVLFRNQMQLGAQMNLLERPPYNDRTLAFTAGWNTRDAYRNGAASYQFGDQNGGRSVYWSLEQRLEPLPRFRIGFRKEQLRITYADRPRDTADQTILTLNYEIDPERMVGLRWVSNRFEFGGRVRASDNLYLTYLQRLRSGQELYLLWGAPNANQTQNRLAVKLVSPVEW
ncbi:MAG: carbohydrate binding family 9 domain-containing protein [Fimbriimonadales bacterium]|nr:carbohydrate binding family 9 domain-containing protein [Fimbriimonadales bacterium]